MTLNNHNPLDHLPVPQAKPEFQQHLEDNLIHLMSEKGEPPMTPIPLPAPQRRVSASLTLIAALITLFVVLSFAIWRNNTPFFQTTAQGTETPLASTGCDTDYARIIEPADGVMIIDPVNIVGTAYAPHGEVGLYSLQLRKTGQEDKGIHFGYSARQTQQTLASFDPYLYPEGDYRLSLWVNDGVNGELYATCTINITIKRPGLGVPSVDIVVARENLRAGEILAEYNLVYRRWAEEHVPLSAITDMNDVIGKYVITDINAGAPIQGNLIDTRLIPLQQSLSMEAVDVVIAIQPIEEGQMITSEMVALRPRPLSSLPPRYFTELDDVIGKVAWMDIYREQPVHWMMVSETAVTPEQIIIPDHTRMVSIPVFEAQPVTLRAGDYVDVFNGSELLAQHALVVYVGTVHFPSDSTGSEPLDQPMVSVAVMREESEALVAAIDAGASFDFVVWNSTTALDTEGRVPVAIPKELIQTNTSLDVGIQVDIVTALLFVDVDEEFQTLETTDGQPRLTMQNLSENGVITAIDETGVTVSVLSREATALSYLVEAKVPIMLIPKP